MMKKIILFVVFIINITICTAPVLSEEQREKKEELVIERIEEWEREQEFIRWSNDLGFRESGNNPDTVNKIGCFGEYQFKESTLHFLGYRQITLKEFKINPNIFPKEVQREALRALIKSNWIELQDYQSYIGQTIGGVLVTKSGMLAAAHLGGAGSVKLFLLSSGRINNRDMNKTTIKKYLREFQGYEF